MGARAIQAHRAVTGLVAAVALTACGTQVAAGGGEPAPLRIGAASSTSGGTDAARSGGGGSMTLDGRLPTGPDRAAVQRYGTDRMPEDRVRALASALGLTADPVRRAHGWEVGAGGAVLRVRDADGEWSYSRAGLTCPVYLVDVESASSDTAVSCGAAEPGTAGPTPAVPVPTAAQALTAATPVLAASGSADAARVLPYTAGLARTVAADPVVAGLPTSGVGTVVDVDRLGVADAHGRLGGTTEGPTYPLVSAKAAYDALAALPRAMPELACVPSEDGPTVCPEPEPMVVTGARLGLVLAHEDGAPLLVPAWLFAVRGSDDPLTAIAVQPRYLADPDPATGPTGGSEPGSSGSPAPAPSASADPGAPPGLGPLVVAMTSASLSQDGRTLTLEGWGGNCATYSGAADESSTAVKAQIVGTSTLGPDQACDAMAVEVSVSVDLERPMGSRTLYDATTGERVPVTRA